MTADRMDVTAVLLARLYRIGPDGTGYRRGLRALRRAVLAHAAREEREEFPALEKLGRTRRRMLVLGVTNWRMRRAVRAAGAGGRRCTWDRAPRPGRRGRCPTGWRRTRRSARFLTGRRRSGCAG